jgi:hypothetical protein
MSREQEERNLGTADFAAAADAPPQPTTEQEMHTEQEMPREGEPLPLAALFPPDVASGFQSRWDQVQIGFVDDPRDAVRQADELVAQVMKSLAESFADERDRIERELDTPDNDTQATENMRMALRRYRSFFQRLLSL